MSRAIPLEKIINISLQGMKNAFNNYYKWSGGDWLGYAPESYIQSEIARALSEESPFVTLEDTVRDIQINSGSERRGNQSRGNSSGRVDIIVWWKDGGPRILMEVKKSWGYNVINSDAKRLRELLHRGGTLQRGLIMVYTDARKELTINNRFKFMATNSDTQMSNRIGPIKKVDDGEIWYWDAACFIVNQN